MARRSRYNPAIERFIANNVHAHPGDIASLTAKEFNVTRVTANRYLDRLMARGALRGTGETKAREYFLVNTYNNTPDLSITPKSQEHLLYREHVAPHLEGIRQNVVEIFEYGVSEVINNVIDHSQSKNMDISVRRNAANVLVVIRDRGIGIFNKIVRECHLNDPREAILELSKGKLTTDPDRHTGEGIFFSSRMCDCFSIHSGDVAFVHVISHGEDDYVIEVEERSRLPSGTSVGMEIAIDTERTVQEIFRKYETEDDGGVGKFVKTHVPVRLALYPNEQLVSRSQARRVLARFNKFSEVMLDFQGVPMIGQAFADEIFRVFTKEHPEIALVPVRMSPEVQDMVKRAVGNGASSQVA